MEEETKQSKEKKVRVATHRKVESIDLNTTPPPPCPTQIVQEEVPNPNYVPPTIPYMQALSEKLKQKFDKYKDLQDFINQLPNLFSSIQQLNKTNPIVNSRPHDKFLQSPNTLTSYKSLHQNPRLSELLNPHFK